MKRILASVFVATALLSAPAFSQSAMDVAPGDKITVDKVVKCKVKLFGKLLHEGRSCGFTNIGGGSFILNFPNAKTLNMFAYVMLDKGAADVAVNVSPAENGEMDWSRNAGHRIPGTFTRSKKDKACWVNGTDEICAW